MMAYDVQFIDINIILFKKIKKGKYSPNFICLFYYL